MNSWFGATIIVALALAVAPLAANALEPEECSATASDPDVWMVRTGGLWTVDGSYGHFRVAVRKVGVEHSRDLLEVQVISVEGDSLEDEHRKLLRCTLLKPPLLKGYVESIGIRSVSERAAVVELDIEMKAMEGVVLREVLLVFPDGRVEKVVEAKYVDILDLLGR